MWDRFISMNTTTTRIKISIRESEVINLLAQGFTCKEIATVLNISYHTVASHKKNLIEKYDARNTVEMVVKAINNSNK